MTSAPSPEVQAVFDAYSPPLRRRLLALRALILETAEATEGVGSIEETLKWGQPSYLTVAPKTGTTIRIDSAKDRPDACAMYVHCQTNLVETFRQLHPSLEFDGDRAIILDGDADLPLTMLRECVTLALTYHTRKT